LRARPPEKLNLRRVEEHLDQRETHTVDVELISPDARNANLATDDQLSDLGPVPDGHVDSFGVDVESACGPFVRVRVQDGEASDEPIRFESCKVQLWSIPLIDLDREPLHKLPRKVVRHGLKFHRDIVYSVVGLLAGRAPFAAAAAMSLAALTSLLGAECGHEFHTDRVTALARCGHEVGVPPIGVKHARYAAPTRDRFPIPRLLERTIVSATTDFVRRTVEARDHESPVPDDRTVADAIARRQQAARRNRSSVVWATSVCIPANAHGVT
jgi:hypothetical protein